MTYLPKLPEGWRYLHHGSPPQCAQHFVVAEGPAGPDGVFKRIEVHTWTHRELVKRMREKLEGLS